MTKGAYESIKEKVIGLTINIDDKEFTFDENNTIISKNDIRVQFDGIPDEISLGDILDNNVRGYEIESDELDDIRNDLDWSITHAQEYADRNEAYSSIIKSIEDVIGNVLRDDKKHVIYDKELKGMLIKINLRLNS